MAIGQLIPLEDKLWELQRSFPKTSFSKNGEIDKEFLSQYKKWLGVDHVLQNSTHFMFVNEVTEPEWEELKTETN